MKLSLKPEHFKRYKDIALLLWRYGRADLVRQSGLDAALAESAPPEEQIRKPEELADDLERMGPTFIKLGQLLSSRIDLLPAAYVEALARLQDNVKPFDYSAVEEIVQVELGIRISKAFSRFEEKPLAAASLGQVHRASLRDGREVVVKVLRPEIRQQIQEDLDALEQIAVFMDRHTEMGRRYRFARVFDELRQSLVRELDYQREASNLVALGQSLRDFPTIIVPQPVDDYTTSRVLTMDYIRGVKITAISPLARLETNGKALAEELFRAYLKQVLVDGLFHADPHPGNVLLTEDGRLALLDLGMVGRLTSGMQDQLLRLLLAISEGRSDEAADIMIRISETQAGFDESEFRRKIAGFILENRNNTMRQIDTGAVLMEVSRSAASAGLLAPPELTILGKTLLSMDQVGRVLDPEFNPNASVRRNATQILNQRMLKSMSPSNIMGSMLDVRDFVSNLPGRLNKILDAVANAELELKIRTADATTLLDGFQKIANRIAAGLILAALIVGAAILMSVETRFRLFGYPGLAMICFLLAAGGAFWLLFDIFVHDYKEKRRRLPPI